VRLTNIFRIACCCLLAVSFFGIGYDRMMMMILFTPKLRMILCIKVVHPPRVEDSALEAAK
jgi:hypothetical protein